VINNLVFVTVDERLNSLANVISVNTSFPVINCTPLQSDTIFMNMWSNSNPTSDPEAAAKHVASLLGLGNFMIWSKLRVNQLNNQIAIKKIDTKLRRIRHPPKSS